MINKNVININSYRRIKYIVKNYTEQSLKIKKGLSQFNIEEVSLDENSVASINDSIFSQYMPFECLVSFIIEYGEKVNKNESEECKNLMMSYHSCVKFYGIKYYIPNYRFNDKEQAIYNYLVSNYKSH